VAEVFAAELRTEAEVLGELEDRLLELLVTEAVPGDCVAGRRKVVEVVGAGEFRGLERELGRRAADDDGQMVGRAGRSTQGGDLLREEVEHRFLIEHGLRLLIEEGLVRTSPTL